MSCVFCKIVAGEIPATKVHETPDIVVIRDLHPQAPVHVLVLPKKHVASLAELDDPGLAAAILKGVKDAAAKEGLKEFRAIANTGEGAGQTVFHLHFHVMGGRSMKGLG